MKKWIILSLLLFGSLHPMENQADINPVAANQETFASKAKKFVSAIAPYFTAKENFIGAQLGIIAGYEAVSFLSGRSVSTKGAQIIDSSCEPLHSIVKKMNYNKPTFLMLAPSKNTAGTAELGNVGFIAMDSDFYNTATEAEKTFVIGHEISHMKNYHAEQQTLMGGVILAGTVGSLLAYDKITQALFEKLEKSLKLDEKSFSARALQFLKRSNHAIATAPLVHWFISKYLYYKFSQSCEREADRESAQLLNSAQGGISFFEKDIAQDAAIKNSPWYSYLNPFTALKYANRTLGFLNHPSHEERIALLKKHL